MWGKLRLQDCMRLYIISEAPAFAKELQHLFESRVDTSRIITAFMISDLAPLFERVTLLNTLRIFGEELRLTILPLNTL